MLKVLGWTIVVLVFAVGTVVAYAATKPDSFRVARSLAIGAPPEQLFPLINDLRAFNRWNPFERKDPGQGIHSGAPEGIGASFAWESAKTGKGSMTIVESSAPSTVVMRLDFLKPFAAQNKGTFTIIPRDGGSEVTWAMDGQAPLMTKIMDVVVGMDRLVGADFAEGLRNLKEIAEKP